MSDPNVPAPLHSPLPGFSRRNFVQALLATGAGLAAAGCDRGTPSAPAPTTNAAPATAATAGARLPQVDPTLAAGGTAPVHIAVIGTGPQGRMLLDLAQRIPGVHVDAICDIWSYSQRQAVGLAKPANPNIRAYDDYRQLLDKEKNLQAAIVATCDTWHAPITNDCLKAGLHVYCEKEMANTLEAARSMVQTARETKKLLQIGHQRRSNPFYLHALELMNSDKNLFGSFRIVTGQWNQLKPVHPLSDKMLAKYTLPPETLEKWGFASMAEFAQWRWFKKLSGGPMADLGSHQVDVFLWFLKAAPRSVIAFGDADAAREEALKNKALYVPESFDHTMALYEWEIAGKIVRGYYHVNLRSSCGGYFEIFQGDCGSVITAENPVRAGMFREPQAGKPAPDWVDQAEKIEKAGDQMMSFSLSKSWLDLGKMDPVKAQALVNSTKPPHQPHLENFFAAVRGKAALNCPAEDAFKTAVAVLKANESAQTGQKITFKPEDFIA